MSALIQKRPKSRCFKLKKRYGLYLLASCALHVNAAHTNTLEPLVIRGEWLGTASDADVFVYPGSRNTISAEALQEHGALHLEDALRTTPGLHIMDETGTGILPNIGVRGLNPLRSERVQFLVDGYPIAIGPYTNVGISLFPVTLASIESVDIVRGGAAVHYGPNNVGGVLNMHSKAIPRETRQTLSQKLTLAEESGHLFKDTYYRIGGAVNEALALQFQANIQRGEGARAHAKTDVNNVIFAADYRFNAQNNLRAQLQYYDVDAELPGALSPAAYAEDRNQSQRPYDAYKADMLRGTLTWTVTHQDNIELQWRNFAHTADRTFYFGQRLGSGDHWADPALPSTHLADSPRLFKVFGTEPRLSFRQGQHQIILGARYLYEEVDFDVNRAQFATEAYANVRDWHFETDAFAFYVSDTLELLNQRLAITPGIRYEKVTTDYADGRSTNTTKNSVDQWLPGLTLGFQARDDLFLFANAQRSLVPVQTAQVTREGEVANESAWNYELGARLDFSDHMMAEITLFRIDYDDLIQFDRPSNRYQNLGKASSQGVEITGDWQLNTQFDLNLSYSYLDTEQQSGATAGNRLPNAPEQKIAAKARYSSGTWHSSLTAQYVSSSFSDAANTVTETVTGSAGKLPSYTLINAHLGKTVPLGAQRELTLGLSINNLLDDDYYFRGVDVSPVGRLPAPGRSFMVEARLNF